MEQSFGLVFNLKNRKIINWVKSRFTCALPWMEPAVNSVQNENATLVFGTSNPVDRRENRKARSPLIPIWIRCNSKCLKQNASCWNLTGL
jgi:hypothetical protein